MTSVTFLNDAPTTSSHGAFVYRKHLCRASLNYPQCALALLGTCLRGEEVPFVFDPQPESWLRFREQVAADLGINERELVVVGSGRLGYSLKPGNNLKAFTDRSDIDVVVVNARLFDELWMAFLSAVYPRHPATRHLGGWISDRRSEIYTGYISPRDIQIDSRIYGIRAKPVNQFRLHWFTTLKKASQHPPRRHSDVKARLYRTWRHAELYHSHSLTQLRTTLAN